MEQRQEILSSGRIAQLEAENNMLKDQIKRGAPNAQEMLQTTEEKARLLQQQLDEKDEKIRGFITERDQMTKRLDEQERDVGNNAQQKDQEIAAQQTQIAHM